MWAYLFWTVVVAWLFTLRPKRDIEDDRAQIHARPSSTLGNPNTNANGIQHGHCAHTCCHVHAHTHSNGHGMEQTQSPVVLRPNADPEIKTPAREELSWADQSYGTPSERDDSASDSREHLGRFRRDMPPHLDRSVTRSLSGSVAPSTKGKSTGCWRCGTEVVSKLELQNHKRNCTGGTGSVRGNGGKRSKFLDCAHCGRQVDSQFNLNIHISSKHPEAGIKHPMSTLPPGFVECPICGRTADSVNNLRSHMLAKHGPDLSSAQQVLRSPMLEEPVLPVGNEVCDICGTAFEDDYQLNQHKGVHHAWSQFCSHCSVSLDNLEFAMEHYVNVHGARNVHPQRIQAFMDNLRPQVETYGEDLVFNCEVCGEEFVTRADLKTHYESPFAHGTKAEQSPHFPPLVATRSWTPPKLDLGSIDTDQQLPSFGMPVEDGETTMVSEQFTESTDSDPVTTANESVRIDSTSDSIDLEKSHTRDVAVDQEARPDSKTEQEPVNNKHVEPSSSSGSDDELFTPHSSTLLIRPQTYIPVQVADIETQVPSFHMPTPGKASSAFPPVVPGPLPALVKAPVAAWSKPLLAKAVPPPDRPLDVQPKRFDPSQYRQDTTTSASRRVSSDRAWSGRIDQSNHQSNSGNDWNNNSRRPSPTTRRPWSERAPAEPKKRALGFDTAAYRARHPQKPEPEVRVGLEPIWDSTDWEVITPQPTTSYRQYQPTQGDLYAQEQRAKAEARDRLAREAEQREMAARAAAVEAGTEEEDPYGGW